MNSYVTFGEILSMSSQDIEQKRNYDGWNDGITDGRTAGRTDGMTDNPNPI